MRRLALVGVALFALVAPAWSDSCGDAGGDQDGDGVCTAVDNCPDLANSGQVDVDGDGAGDVCDPADAEASVVRLFIRRDSSSSDDNSKIKTRGFLFTQPPGDTFDTAAGVTFTFSTSNGIVETFPFAAVDCVSKRPGKSVCLSPDRLWKATFKAFTKSPQVINFVAAFRRIGLGQLAQGPVSYVVTHGAAVDRTGTIGDCRVDSNALNCREF